MGQALGPYGRLARWVLHHRGPVAVALVVIGVVAVVMASFLRVEANLLALLPADDPHARALTELHEREGGANTVTITFEATSPERVEEMHAALEALARDLEALEEVDWALHRVDGDLARHIGLLQLDPVAVDELSVRLKGALALGPALNPIVTQRLMDMGPLTEKIATASDLPLLDGQGERGRILVRPTGSALDRYFAPRLMAEVERVLAEAELEAAGARLEWIGGAYRHNVEDLQGIRQDLLVTSLGSLVLVVAVIVAAFRSLRATILVMTPLVLANATNLGLTWLTIGHITTYTSFGTAVLVGLGIDFAVHLIGRYREERLRGRPVEEAIPRAWDRVAPPSVTAALTSAAAFMALAAADNRGFSQLGTMLAVGLMLCLVAMLVVLPVLIPVLDANPKALLFARPHPGGKRPSTYRLAPHALMVAVVATGFAASLLTDLEWEYDMSELRRTGLSYEELTPEERDLARESYSPVLVEFEDEAALRRAQQRAENWIAEGRLPQVRDVLSIQNVLPPDQERRVAALSVLRELVEHPNLRYLPPPLVQQLLPLRDWTPHTIVRDDLPRPVLDLLAADGGNGHRLLVLPAGNMWDLREAAALKDELGQVFPNEVPAGEYVVQGAVWDVVKRDMPIVAALALFLVAALTAIDLRKPYQALGAVGTLLAGMTWAGVALVGFGVKLSIVNIVAVPILLGIGIDVVIHLLHRLKEEGPGGVRRALSTTGVAATISTVTTILSFSSLLLAGNRGVRSLGLVVVIGLTAVFLASAILLPLAWAAGWKVTGRAPADQRRRAKEREPEV